MNKIVTTAMLAALIGVQGCTTQKTREEYRARAWARTSATLNTYDDNRVGIKMNDQRYIERVSWSWTTNAQEILALNIADRLYNAKDIDRISIEAYRREDPLVTVLLKSGEQIEARAGYDYGPYWTSCDTNKTCKSQHWIAGAGSNKGFPLDIYSIYEKTLANHTKFSNKFRYEYSEAQALPNNSNFLQVTFLDNEALRQLIARVDAREQALKEMAIQISREAEKENRLKKEKVAHLRKQHGMVPGAELLTMVGPYSGRSLIMGCYLTPEWHIVAWQYENFPEAEQERIRKYPCNGYSRDEIADLERVMRARGVLR